MNERVAKTSIKLAEGRLEDDDEKVVRSDERKTGERKLKHVQNATCSRI